MSTETDQFTQVVFLYIVQAHLAIAQCQERLAKQGRHVVVITQNIDELHKRAGSKDVIELHGNTPRTSGDILLQPLVNPSKQTWN